MTPTDHYDVAIVGARAAGAATAMLLARRGRRVLAVDLAARGSDTRSTHALMKTGVLQLQRWGLLDRLLAAGTPALDRTTFHYDDESVVVPLTPTAEVPALVAPRRTVLDPVLADAAEEAGAELHFDTRLLGLRHTADGRVVGMTTRDADGRIREVTATVVVGADGVRSPVARSVGAPVRIQGHHGGAVAYAYFGEPRSGSPGFDGYEWCYRPGVAAGVIPTNDGVLAWVGVPPDRFEREVRRDVEPAFWRVLREAGPQVVDRIADRPRTSRFVLHAGIPGYLRACHGPGWALVGDASHFKDPLSAHGLTDALRDAELLADALDAGLSDPASLCDALAAYEARRDAMSIALHQATDRIASYEWTMPEVRQHLHDLSLAMRDELRTMRALVGHGEHAA